MSDTLSLTQAAHNLEYNLHPSAEPRSVRECQKLEAFEFFLQKLSTGITFSEQVEMSRVLSIGHRIDFIRFVIEHPSVKFQGTKYDYLLSKTLDVVITTLPKNVESVKHFVGVLIKQFYKIDAQGQPVSALDSNRLPTGDNLGVSAAIMTVLERLERAGFNLREILTDEKHSFVEIIRADLIKLLAECERLEDSGELGTPRFIELRARYQSILGRLQTILYNNRTGSDIQALNPRLDELLDIFEFRFRRMGAGIKVSDDEIAAKAKHTLPDVATYTIDRPEDGKLGKLNFVQGTLGYVTNSSADSLIEKASIQRFSILRWVKNGDYPKLLKFIGLSDLNLNEAEQKLLVGYVISMLRDPQQTKNIFLIDPKFVVKFNEEVNSAEGSTRVSLEKIKQVLAKLSFKIYSEIDAAIDDERALEITKLMRVKMTYKDKEFKEERTKKITKINGHTGAGKDTTLAMLKLKPVATGTDGLAGRGEGYEDYEDVMNAFDLARFAGEFIPTKFMNLLFCLEMLARREEMDAQGRFDEPIVVSGLPRDAKQAELFEGIPDIRSIAMTITPETAVYRTVSRIVEAILAGRPIRPDDVNDLHKKTADGSEPVRQEEVVSEIQRIIEIKFEVGQVDFAQLMQLVSENYLPRLTMSPKSRYFKYDKMLSQIDAVLLAKGIKTHKIVCDGKTKQQVMEEVSNAILSEDVPEIEVALELAEV